MAFVQTLDAATLAGGGTAGSSSETPGTTEVSHPDEAYPIVNIPRLTQEQLTALTKAEFGMYTPEQLDAHLREQQGNAESKAPTLQSSIDAIHKPQYDIEMEKTEALMRGDKNTQGFGFGNTKSDSSHPGMADQNTAVAAIKAQIGTQRSAIPESGSFDAGRGEFLGNASRNPAESSAGAAHTLANLTKEGNVPVAGMVLPEGIDLSAFRASMPNVKLEDVGSLRASEINAQPVTTAMAESTRAAGEIMQKRNEAFEQMLKTA